MNRCADCVLSLLRAYLRVAVGSAFRHPADTLVSAGSCAADCSGTCGCGGFWHRLLELAGRLRVLEWSGFRCVGNGCVFGGFLCCGVCGDWWLRRLLVRVVGVDWVSVGSCVGWVSASGRWVRFCRGLCCGVCGDLRLCWYLGRLGWIDGVSACGCVGWGAASGRCAFICRTLESRRCGSLLLHDYLTQDSRDGSVFAHSRPEWMFSSRQLQPPAEHHLPPCGRGTVWILPVKLVDTICQTVTLIICCAVNGT
ncbi:hypothetical protein BBOU_1408 [Bifidobacterium boum]|uniref:Uncharacterized protein n=1 Tax=Bifidobacterium boum TaxID=78343 RepID=A0A086ZIG9_9BIFI|nr:hypothetical protein BBOU_1408 [Bifidobacterium boum]